MLSRREENDGVSRPVFSLRFATEAQYDAVRFWARQEKVSVNEYLVRLIGKFTPLGPKVSPVPRTGDKGSRFERAGEPAKHTRLKGTSTRNVRSAAGEDREPFVSEV
jgi:hypothetical protein